MTTAKTEAIRQQLDTLIRAAEALIATAEQIERDLPPEQSTAAAEPQGEVA